MSLDSIVQQVLSIAGTFNLTLVLVLFVICTIGEFHIAVPYLLETIWLLSGYHVGSGALPFTSLILLWLSALAGREAGTTALFYLVRLTSIPLGRISQKYLGASYVSEKTLNGNRGIIMRFWRRLTYLSPLSIAVGRLFWLRIPLTMTLGVQKRLKPLSLGVLISAAIWDGAYILVGLAGSRTPLTREQMLLCSLGGLTLLYAITLLVRRLRSGAFFLPRRQ